MPPGAANIAIGLKTDVTAGRPYDEYGRCERGRTGHQQSDTKAAALRQRVGKSLCAPAQWMSIVCGDAGRDMSAMRPYGRGLLVSFIFPRRHRSSPRVWSGQGQPLDQGGSLSINL